MKSRKNKKNKKNKKKVFSKKGGLLPMQNNSSLIKAAKCHQVNEQHLAINPMRITACKNLKHEGEKICKIKLSMKDPHFGNIIHHFPMPTCVVKSSKKDNKSIKKLYKKGELNETTNIGQILNEREAKNKKLQENRKIAKALNDDNFSYFKSPPKTWNAIDS